MMHGRLLLAVALLALSMPRVQALHCVFVDRTSGSVFDMTPIALHKAGENFHGMDTSTGLTYLANWCAPHNMQDCKDHDGSVCVYNTTGGVFKSVLATNTKAPLPVWSTLQAGRPSAGLKLDTDNGFYGPRQAITSTHFSCITGSGGTELHVYPDYVAANFRFEVPTPFACPIGEATVYMKDFGLPLDKSSVRVEVVLSTLPPANFTIELHDPRITADPLFVQGPANAKNTSVFITARLSAVAQHNQAPFTASLVLSGFDGSVFKFPQSTVRVVPYAVADPPSGLSGGSVFLIILFVGGFVYLAAGCLWNHSKHGTPLGVASMPNRGFWVAIWESATVGLKWTLQKLSCGRSGALHYAEIDERTATGGNAGASGNPF